MINKVKRLAFGMIQNMIGLLRLQKEIIILKKYDNFIYNKTFKTKNQ